MIECCACIEAGMRRRRTAAQLPELSRELAWHRCPGSSCRDHRHRRARWPLLYRRSAVLWTELLQLAARRRYGPAASGAESAFLTRRSSCSRLPSPVPGFARLIGDGAPHQFGTLSELLATMLQGPLAISRARLERHRGHCRGVGTDCMATSRAQSASRWCMVTSARPAPTSVRNAWSGGRRNWNFSPHTIQRGSPAG